MADRRSAQDTVCLAVGLGWLLAEHAMWDAEVVAAIGKAATVIPDHDGSGPAAAELADAGMARRPACRG
jgi:hypothetical protein